MALRRGKCEENRERPPSPLAPGLPIEVVIGNRQMGPCDLAGSPTADHEPHLSRDEVIKGTTHLDRPLSRQGKCGGSSALSSSSLSTRPYPATLSSPRVLFLATSPIEEPGRSSLQSSFNLSIVEPPCPRHPTPNPDSARPLTPSGHTAPFPSPCSFPGPFDESIPSSNLPILPAVPSSPAQDFPASSSPLPPGSPLELSFYAPQDLEASWSVDPLISGGVLSDDQWLPIPRASPGLSYTPVKESSEVPTDVPVTPGRWVGTDRSRVEKSCARALPPLGRVYPFPQEAECDAPAVSTSHSIPGASLRRRLSLE